MPTQSNWDFRRILILLTRNWWFPLGMLAFTLIAARLYLRYATTTYKSDATIQIDLAQTSLVKAGKGGEAFFLPIESLTDAYVELFTTHELVEAIVRELKLDWEIYSVGKVGRSLAFPPPFWIETSDSLQVVGRDFYTLSPLYIELRGDSGTFKLTHGDSILCVGLPGRWLPCGNGKIRLIPTRPEGLPAGTFAIHRIPERIAVHNWQRRISLLPKRGYTTWLISVTDISPARAQRFLYKLLEHSREYERMLRQAQYQRALLYVDTLLHAVRTALTLAQDSLFMQERNTEMPFASTRRERVLALFTEIEKKRTDFPQEEALLAIEKAIQRLYDSIAADPGASTALIPITPALPEELRTPLQGINDLIERREKLLQIYTAQAAPVVEMTRLLLRRLMQAQHITRELLDASIESNLRHLREWKLQREKLYKDISSERHFSLLQEDIALRRDIYKALLEKRIQLSIDKEAILSAIRIVQPPTVPDMPLSPNPIQVYVIALVLGLILGVGGVLLWHFIHQRVSYRVDLEGLSPVPVLGELPYSREAKGLFAFSGLQLEVLRSLRGALGFLWEEGAPKVIVVTSTVSGEGKSFVARGLAYVYALLGQRVLLIDADLRRATITQQVGFPTKGLSLLLANPHQLLASYQEYIVPMGRKGLDLLPAGPSPPNPAELLESPTFNELIRQLADQYEVFVIDTAPVGLVPDGLSVLRQLPFAVTLYVFRADYSRIPFLNHLAEVVKLHRLQKVYLLFNGTRLAKPRYGYGYGYGYYGDGYASRYYYTGRNGRLPLWKRIRELLPI